MFLKSELRVPMFFDFGIHDSHLYPLPAFQPSWFSERTSRRRQGLRFPIGIRPRGRGQPRAIGGEGLENLLFDNWYVFRFIIGISGHSRCGRTANLSPGGG
jgi:hypothetical protein